MPSDTKSRDDVDTAAADETSTDSAASLTGKAGRARIREMVMAAIGTDIEPVKVTTTYRIGLFVVGFCMVLIPIMYLVLVVSTAIGTYWHAMHSFSYLERHYGGFWAVVLYVCPLIGGIFLVPFMIKPLFFRNQFSQRPRRLKREAQPLLYDYVEHLCDAVGAPVPKSIRIDSMVNASAGMRHGLWSLLGNDLTLTLGLPLVKGLTLRQMTGVLAHEFGHFSQSAGMRASYLVRTTNHWLGMAAFHRDAWDAWLEHLSKNNDIRLMPIFWIARFFVWCQRCVMMWLYWFGAAISGYLSREMEYDADRYETRVGGVRTFIQTTRQLRVLNVAHSIAMQDLQQFMDEGRLADDLAALIVANTEWVTPEMKKKLREMARDETTGFFDTHPADRDRIASARDEDTDGIFHLPAEFADLPATVLFEDFERISRAVTFEFYKEQLGPTVKKKDLHPVDELLTRQKADIDAGKALYRYFQVRIPALRPLPIAEDAADRPEDPKAVGERLKEARGRMLEELPVYEGCAKRYSTAEGAQFLSIGALTLCDAGLRPNASDFGLRKGTKKEASARFDAAREALATLAGKMLPFENEAGDRLSAALQLLRLNRVCARIENGQDLRDEIERLLGEAMFVSELMAELPPFRVLYHQCMFLFHNLSGSNGNWTSGDRQIIELILDKAAKLRVRLKSLSKELGDQLYPFDHAKADMTLKEWCLPEVPKKDEVGSILGATEMVLDRLTGVQMRLFARLAHAAEKVETALGLEPLPDPEEKEKAEKIRKEAEERERAKKRREKRRKQAAARRQVEG